MRIVARSHPPNDIEFDVKQQGMLLAWWERRLKSGTPLESPIHVYVHWNPPKPWNPTLEYWLERFNN